MVSMAGKRMVFLELSQTLSAGTKESKLSGRQEWEFSLKLPSTIPTTASLEVQNQSYRLPESSAMRDPNSHSITYEIAVIARRARFKTNYK